MVCFAEDGVRVLRLRASCGQPARFEVANTEGYAAAVATPLLILWGLVERLLGRGGRRRADPFGRQA